MKRTVSIAVALVVLLTAGAFSVLYFAYGVRSADDLVSLVEGAGVAAKELTDELLPEGGTGGTASDEGAGASVAVQTAAQEDTDTASDSAAEEMASGGQSGSGDDNTAAADPEAADQATTGQETADLGTADQGAPSEPESAAAGAQSGTQQEQLAALPDDADEQTSAAPKIAPSFDIVRVEKTGEAVIAGQAAPFSIVRVYDGDRMIGETTADATGAWVLLPGDMLAPGNHALSLVAVAPDGTETRSEQVAVIVVPEIQYASDALGDKSLTPEDPVVDAAASAGEQIAALPEDDLTSGEKEIVHQAEGDKQPLVVLMSEEQDTPSKVLQGANLRQENDGIREDGLVLESIDYNTEGGSIVAGQAPPGAQIIVYLDNKVVAHVTVGEDGRWRVDLGNHLEPGLHVLRIDQVDENGKVLARVETPYAKPESVPEALDIAQFVVQPGNSLWRISRRSYGKGVLYSVIFEANREQIRDPDLIYPGQIFTIPRVE